MTEAKTERVDSSEPFDAQKVALIKKHLEFFSGKGRPIYYDIAVNGMKAVEKTNDIAEFDAYKELMPSAGELVITVYSKSFKSPKVSKRSIFRIGESAKPANQGLNGVELEGIISNRINLERERWDNGLTREKLDARIKELAEKEALIQKLTEENQLLKSNKAKSELKWVDIGATLLEGLVRRNPHLVEKIPGMESLSGLIEQDNKDKDTYQLSQAKGSEVSFTRKKENEKLSEEEEKYMGILRQMEEVFDYEQMQAIMAINHHLSSHPEDIHTVAELLELKLTTPTHNE